MLCYAVSCIWHVLYYSAKQSVLDVVQVVHPEGAALVARGILAFVPLCDRTGGHLEGPEFKQQCNTSLQLRTEAVLATWRIRGGCGV